MASPFLLAAELNSHLYPEISTEISRGDASFMDTAINAAIEECSSFLSNYDTDAIFSQTGDARNPIIFLYTKDIAVWHFLALSNAAVELEFREMRYKLAITFLKHVQDGKANPQLPIRTSEGTPGIDYKRDVKYGGNKSRDTHY